MELIKGRKIADTILANIKEKIEKTEPKPTLAVVLIGEDQASQIYVGLKQREAENIGMGFELFKYPSCVSEDIILAKIAELNQDKKISGIIVQLPLPEELDRNKIINAIASEKDVDGFNCENQRKFCCGDTCKILPVFPKAIIKMIEVAIAENSLKDIKSGVVICNSEDFGLIMQEALNRLSIDSDYVLCDKFSTNLDKLAEADILVSACGRQNLIKASMVKDGVVIIDGGITKIDGRVVGDINIDSFQEKRSFISPVPGGVGPVTVACLLENTFLASLK